MAFDTWKEKNADDREFAENRRALYAQPPLKAGTKGTNTANHPSRAVHKGRFMPNEDIAAPNPANPRPSDPPDDYEPDFESMHRARQERHRPDWA